ncbi:trypsin-1 [Amyelois transitella]|uniref:trypsin-1 n=1 Tax=Amyelois transitella TaxID=680683 RepID=UPI00067CFFF4|nr:trypsin-1 [Amyelois transitella]
MLFLKCMTIISLNFVHGAQEMAPKSTMEIDYSFLAGQAEKNKHDILNFLNRTSVRHQYKVLYQCLLEKILGGNREDTWNTRRENLMSETRRIVLGHNTSIASIPWQVSLREKTYPICGGSVVSDIWLLTAAHCLLRARPSDLSVRLGSSWKTHGGEMYDVKECYVHPRYISKSKINDVGLVRLYSPLRFSSKILPINLVAREARLLSDEVAIVSGWGKLQEAGVSATFLQSTTIRTIAMKHCLRSGLDRKAINPPSMFCAGSFKQPSPDACQGDSGGPLVKDGLLIGVVSWGLGCARGNFPGVYTRLSQPMIWDWVQGHLARKPENATV